MYTDVNDTIVAVSSARGHGLRGIVRLSGPGACAIAARLCGPGGDADLATAPGFTQYRARIALDDRESAPATVFVFRAPHSYTRQDLVELHTVGAPPLLDMLVERCLAAGARTAEPGEFTARAFLAGAISLDAAEAVAATIRARSDGQLRAARRALDGHLAADIRAWQDELTDLLALVVADIDFADEPIDFISPDELTARVSVLRGRLGELLATAARGERHDVLPHILLLGPPNSGKSTLLNRLAGMDRAIASAVAGTTRDILEAPVRLGAHEAVLLDAAGIDEDPDEIVAHGRQRALDAAGRVDLVCVVWDLAQPVISQSMDRLVHAAHAPTLTVATRRDLVTPGVAEQRVAELSACAPGPALAVSAVTGEGIDALRAALERRIAGENPAGDDAGLVLSARQRRSLLDAAEALDRCAEQAAAVDDVLDVAELLAVDLREAADALAAITGAVTTEDLLGRVFATFCIGK